MKYSETSYLMKKRLASTLREMLMQQSFPQITVSEIVETCGVNRKTFYYHFSDIHALIGWMFAEEFRDLIRPCDSADSFAHVADHLMDYVEQNEALFYHIVDTVGEDGLKRGLFEDLLELQDNIIQKFELRYGVKFEAEFRAFLMKFFAEAAVGIFMEWVRRKQYQNRETTIEYFRDMVRTTLPALIEHRVHLSNENLF